MSGVQRTGGPSGSVPQSSQTGESQETTRRRTQTMESGMDLPSRPSTRLTGGFTRRGTQASEAGSSIFTSLSHQWKKLTLSPGARAAADMQLPPPTGPKAQVIAKALDTAVKTDGAKILAVDYSPTGGGHTARTLNIVAHGLETGEIGQGSTVVFSVPEQWATRPQVPPQMLNLANAMQQKGINVLVVGSDKSVKGFLQPSGASDDPEIIRNFANQPKRLPVVLGHVQEAEVFNGSNPEIFSSAKTISGRDLMQSIVSLIGENAAKEKVFVLTDMAPDLQKGAMQAGIPGDHRVDQQNHAILLDMSSKEANHTPVNAILTKVLGGTGERVSHIALGGETNPIGDALKTADKLKIGEDTGKAEARDKVVAALLRNGRRAAPSEAMRNHVGEGPVKAEEGILFHQHVDGPEDIKNVMYVYAHGFQTPVGHHIEERLSSDDCPPEYRNTMFVLCGPKAVPGMNAMHMGYVCDADAVTTAGAGTNGEYAYLSKQAGAQSTLMALPIKGHNEQEVNADFLKADPVIGPRVTVAKNYGDEAKATLDQFVKASYENAQTKYAEGSTMGSIIAGMKNPTTYVTQAHDLLFHEAEPSAETKKIMEIEKGMRDDPKLKEARKGVKIATQALTQLKHALTTPNHPGRIELRLTQKGALHSFKDVADLYDKVFKSESTFLHFVRNDEIDGGLHRLGSAAKRRMSTKGKEPASEPFPMFKAVQNLLWDAAKPKLGSLDKMLSPKSAADKSTKAAGKMPESATPLHERIDHLRHEMGEVIRTGF